MVGGIFHELGHAIAASALDCRLNSVGMFVTFVYPGAFVDVDADDLGALSPWHQLQVVCAGAWHNIVLATLAYALISVESLAMQPLFVTTEGVTMRAMLDAGPLAPLIAAHDRLTSIDDCRVDSIDTWRECLATRLYNTSAPPKLGYCIDDEQLSAVLSHYDQSNRCCESETDAGVCFKADHEHVNEDCCCCVVFVSGVFL
jgi:S2P endopeptidase